MTRINKLNLKDKAYGNLMHGHSFVGIPSGRISWNCGNILWMDEKLLRPLILESSCVSQATKTCMRPYINYQYQGNTWFTDSGKFALDKWDIGRTILMSSMFSITFHKSWACSFPTFQSGFNAFCYRSINYILLGHISTVHNHPISSITRIR